MMHVFYISGIVQGQMSTYCLSEKEAIVVIT